MSFEGPFSPLGIASRFALKQEMKSVMHEDIGSAVMIAFSVVTAVFLGCIAYNAGWGLITALNRLEDDGRSLS